jgi:hypothetical protein
MLIDLINGNDNIYPAGVQDVSALTTMRGISAYMLAPYYIYVYEEMRNEARKE